VLVTGGSGFVAGHLILRLLGDGFTVRTTVRPGRAAVVQGAEVVEADLLADAGWGRAAAGCAFVLHAASPLPAVTAADPAALVAAAEGGSLRVLRAARDAGVRRVVLTSSFAAIGYGHGGTERVLTEADWTDPGGPDVLPYTRSKTLAERAAWDFIAGEGGGMELAAVNPVVILGPVHSAATSASIEIVRRLLAGAPAVPRLSFGIVDVRDVAELHLRAMLDPGARGERFIATAGTASLLEIARLIRARLGGRARRVPRWQAPDLAIRALAPFSAEARVAARHLGVARRTTSEKARRLLDWEPRRWEDTVVDTAESLFELGVVRG
jgi:dihydroflavonol-4-reductase